MTTRSERCQGQVAQYQTGDFLGRTTSLGCICSTDIALFFREPQASQFQKGALEKVWASEEKTMAYCSLTNNLVILAA